MHEILLAALIIFLAIITFLLINSLRLRLKHWQQLAEQEKLKKEETMNSARLQLDEFRQDIKQKTDLIDQLKKQLQYNDSTVERQQFVFELCNQTILTEEDWEKFKLHFEKIFPFFFKRLKTLCPEITLAEQRIAALIRMQLTTKQMASVLGISPNSVNKTKQRLRLRLNIDAENHIEKFVSEV